MNIMNISSRKQAIRFNFLARKFLFQLGNSKPTRKQLAEMNKLLSTLFCHGEKMLIMDDNLTTRETACLVLIARGKTTQEISKILGVRSNTVKTYRHRIIKKLDCVTMAQAVFEGIRYGMVEKDKKNELRRYL